MKIVQKPEYSPITIVLERREEAIALFSIMDKLCDCSASLACDITPGMISADEHQLAVKLSNAVYEKEVIF